MPELLLEVGCEELPATFVRNAVHELAEKLAGALSAATLLGDPAVQTFSTPRRLIISFPDVIARQPDAVKEMRGPAIRAAFTESGDPTPALLGFCRGQGVDVADIRRDDQYVWVTRPIPGLPAVEVLRELLPKAIRELSFPKSMRWGSSRLRFARPIRWILAAYGGEVVPFTLESVTSGLESRGHRFYAPETFTAATCESLLTELRRRSVEPDPALREMAIRVNAQSLANGRAEIDDDLLQENVYLTEWPTVVRGEFPAPFLDLPEPVLVTAMAKHEKMFPIRREDGTLDHAFLFVRNSGEDETVRRGCAWVLTARFSDAQFFAEEDRKFRLDEFLERTSTIVFQEKLGSVRSRADRLARLAAEVADATGAASIGADPAEREWAIEAARLAKADLATGLVSELSSLQGVIGAEYAIRDGYPAEVAWAIRHQYAPHRHDRPADSAAHRTGLRLAIADQLDKLAGYLGLGLEPTGSSDPFALRRAATVLIETAWAWPGAMPAYDQLFGIALAEYKAQGVDLGEAGAHAALYDLFEGRYAALLADVRHDVRDAAMMREHRWELTIPQGIRFRIAALQNFLTSPAEIQTATRPLNLVASARKKGIEYAFTDPVGALASVRLDSSEGEALAEIVRSQEDDLMRAAREGDVATVVAGVRRLIDPINAFMDGTMVMAEDEAVRFARLTLLHAVSLQLLHAGDFTRIVVD
ncbi:MAG: glycine--tRNA ligase subunit beta [Fimbriimonadaceae bacterium]|nr:glycine--tRNA ligase subunit beta [Fimbriimonadaceae bacterium]